MHTFLDYDRNLLAYEKLQMVIQPITKVLKAIAKYSWQLSNLVAFINLNSFVKIDLQK